MILIKVPDFPCDYLCFVVIAVIFWKGQDARYEDIQQKMSLQDP